MNGINRAGRSFLQNMFSEARWAEFPGEDLVNVHKSGGANTNADFLFLQPRINSWKECMYNYLGGTGVYSV